MSIGRGLGHEMEIVGTERIAELHPFYNLDGIRASMGRSPIRPMAI